MHNNNNKKRNLPVTFINVTMKNINNLTDDIYECLADEDYVEIRYKIKELTNILNELQDEINYY